jgi:hypothetical protein
MMIDMSDMSDMSDFTMPILFFFVFLSLFIIISLVEQEAVGNEPLKIAV